MTIILANLELFFDDHPELNHLRKEVIAAARKKMGETRIISVGMIEEILDPNLLSQFFSEIHGSKRAEHVQVWLNGLFEN